MNKYVQEYMLLINDKVRIELELVELPQGYISKKVISNNVYYYLQRRVKDKIKSEYVKKNGYNRKSSKAFGAGFCYRVARYKEKSRLWAGIGEKAKISPRFCVRMGRR